MQLVIPQFEHRSTPCRHQSGNRQTDTHTHTHRQGNYRNPRSACARGLKYVMCTYVYVQYLYVCICMYMYMYVPMCICPLCMLIVLQVFRDFCKSIGVTNIRFDLYTCTSMCVCIVKTWLMYTYTYIARTLYKYTSKLKIL